ncbi:hypothetical protein C8R44DRAFT_865710 [Mycena epipterygia]|nr:hypothetical protein C8R44DRAFT_865710 [Mycena epipterygia]
MAAKAIRIQELCDNIVAFIPSDKDLRSTPLVSHPFCASSQSRLIHTVSIFEGKNGWFKSSAKYVRPTLDLSPTSSLTFDDWPCPCARAFLPSATGAHSGAPVPRKLSFTGGLLPLGYFQSLFHGLSTAIDALSRHVREAADSDKRIDARLFVVPSGSSWPIRLLPAHRRSYIWLVNDAIPRILNSARLSIRFSALREAEFDLNACDCSIAEQEQFIAELPLLRKLSLSGCLSFEYFRIFQALPITLDALSLHNATPILGDWFLHPACPFDFSQLVHVDVYASHEWSEKTLIILDAARRSITRLRISSDQIAARLDLSRFPALTWIRSLTLEVGGYDYAYGSIPLAEIDILIAAADMPSPRTCLVAEMLSQVDRQRYPRYKGMAVIYDTPKSANCINLEGNTHILLAFTGQIDLTRSMTTLAVISFQAKHPSLPSAAITLFNLSSNNAADADVKAND